MEKHAASLFRCPTKFVGTFERKDPFNQDQLVSGFICRKKGLMGGSLVITKVADQLVEPQLIYGTPKLAYPYLNNNLDYMPLAAHSYYLTEKWNGVNVLFFKYFGPTGRQYISVKSKGAAFIGDSEFGNFLSLTKEAMDALTMQGKVYNQLAKRGVVAASFELCGAREPHLVKYDFQLDLKPLFTIHENGNIKPIVADAGNILSGLDIDIPAVCKASQATDFINNDIYRDLNGLTIKYEYDHFITEGKVLYLLDEAGFVLNRTIFKIKPKCVESCHWLAFDTTMEGRVKEAIEKVIISEEALTEEAIRDELDMGPKEWSKFSRPIIKYCKDQGYQLS